MIETVKGFNKGQSRIGSFNNENEDDDLFKNGETEGKTDWLIFFIGLYLSLVLVRIGFE